MKDEMNQWLIDEQRVPISGGTRVKLTELLSVVSTFKNATADIGRDVFEPSSYVYDGLILLQPVCQKSSGQGWPSGGSERMGTTKFDIWEMALTV
jgi:hypothetical protein